MTKPVELDKFIGVVKSRRRSWLTELVHVFHCMTGKIQNRSRNGAPMTKLGDRRQHDDNQMR